MEGSPDWEKLHSIGQVSNLAARQGDSSVYRVKNENIDVVAKQYEVLRERFLDPEWVKDILRQYYADTEKAQTLLKENPNPLNQKVKIDDEEYALEYEVIPQGGLMLEGKSTYSHRDWYGPKEPAPLVVGQKFSPGANLRSLAPDIKKEKMDPDALGEDQKIFFDDAIADELVLPNQDLFEYLNQELHVDFTYSRMNVKPYLDKLDHKIKISITDLAASITQYYDESESLEELREKWIQIKSEEWESQKDNKAEQ